MASKRKRKKRVIPKGQNPAYPKKEMPVIVEQQKRSKPVDPLAKAGRGRPTLLTDRVHKILVAAVTVGQSEAEAAESIPLDPANVSNWKERGRKAAIRWETMTQEERDDELIYFNFFNDMRSARARGAQSDLKIIYEARQKDWRAAAWRREKLDPENFARQVRVAGIEEAAPVSHREVSSADEEARRIRAKKILDAHIIAEQE